MKYYIEYPIPIKCGLRCSYCFHAEAWELDAAGKFEDKYSHVAPFTALQFMQWRDKHLPDATEFLYELQGGEPSESAEAVFDIIDTLDKGKFQLQTNGLGDAAFYERLINYKDKIDRIGFTWHRAVVCERLKGQYQETFERFERNLMTIKGAGIKCYVKELLLPEYKDDVLQAITLWAVHGVEFRIQDFKGARGRDPEIAATYTRADWDLVHAEYKHDGKTCCCRKGYKQLLIRGYDIFAGDVLACWNDPTVIGNVKADWYKSYKDVNIAPDIGGGRDVLVEEKLYRGTYPRDIWRVSYEKQTGKYENLNKKQLKERCVVMKAYMLEKTDAFRKNMATIDTELNAIAKRRVELIETKLQLQGAIFAYEEAMKTTDNGEAQPTAASSTAGELPEDRNK